MRIGKGYWCSYVTTMQQKLCEEKIITAAVYPSNC
jgi:hypothetical protein